MINEVNSQSHSFENSQDNYFNNLELNPQDHYYENHELNPQGHDMYYENLKELSL